MGLEALQCIYCQDRSSTANGDHVPPQSYFPKKRGYALIKVPCCIECNNKYSDIDERVRNTWVALEEVEKHPIVREHIQPAAKRAFEKNKGKQARFQSGLIIPEGITTQEEMDNAPIRVVAGIEVEEFLERMTKALLYKEWATVVPKDIEFGWAMLDNTRDEIIALSERVKAKGEVRIIGTDNVFKYIVIFDALKHQVLTYMKFYDSLEFGTQILLPDRMFRHDDGVVFFTPDK